MRVLQPNRRPTDRFSLDLATSFCGKVTHPLGSSIPLFELDSHTCVLVRLSSYEISDKTGRKFFCFNDEGF